MQIDPPDNNEQVWNWKANRTEGQSRFAAKKESAKGYPSRVRKKGGYFQYAADFTEQELLTDAFQLYNGYHYWIWTTYDKSVPFLGGKWQKDPKLGKPKAEGGYGIDYGGPAINIYNKVQNNNPPEGW